MPKQRSVEQLIANIGPDDDLAAFACTFDSSRSTVLLRCNLRGGNLWTFLLPPATALALRDSVELAVGAQGWPRTDGSPPEPSLDLERAGPSVACPSCDVHSFSDCAYLAFASTTSAVVAVRLVPEQAAALLADLTALAKLIPGWRAAGTSSLPTTHH